MSEKAIKMDVHAITLDTDANSPILLLKEKDGERSLPIWIGLLEATAIATEMEKIRFERPMTHDLLANMVDTLGATVLRVEVTDIIENTYYARLVIRQGEREILVDARPSDAVALALRTGAEIFVHTQVLGKAIRPRRTEEGESETRQEQGGWTEILEKLDPESFKYKI